MQVPYEAILFDFDGVLADSEPLHHRSWQAVLAPLGLELTWEHYQAHCIGVSDREMLERLGRLATPALAVDELWPLYPLKKSHFQDLVKGSELIPSPTADLLKELRHMKMAVVTSSMRSEIEPILLQSNLLDCFDACVYGDTVQNLKPHPEPYLTAKRLLGVSTALVVEDSAAGKASGEAAGCDVLAIGSAHEVAGRVRSVLRMRSQ